ncbi:MAG: acetate--CoA ligase family protein [Pseudomonadota bacterium]
MSDLQSSAASSDAEPAAASPPRSRLARLLAPRSVAVIGGGTWGRQVVEQCARLGFPGPVWPVHPTRDRMAGYDCVPSVSALPAPPDAVFVAVNREATIAAVSELSAMGAGGAVCFASGFAEAEGEMADGRAAQARLVAAAGAMPVLGPNCYGLVNALDGAVLWPDQHGMPRVPRGVAILAQSSNMLLNLTMQRRGLPLAYAIAGGNQAQIGIAELAAELLADPRVTAIGLHIEGVSDPAAFEALSTAARAAGKPVVALRIGRSEAARAAAVSHTASLAGSTAAAEAFFARLGMPLVRSLPAFLAALTLAHVHGALPGDGVAQIAAMSCSGGEASLVADTALGHRVAFPPLDPPTRAALAEALGPRVHLANPLDYHTYVWGDAAAMERVFAAMLGGPQDLSLLVLDLPHEARCDPSGWDCALEAIRGAVSRTGARTAVMASLPDAMPEPVAAALVADGIAPLAGFDEAMAAAAAMAEVGAAGQRPPPQPLLRMRADALPGLLLIDEAAAKARLAEAGVTIPSHACADTADAAVEAAESIGYPVALKALGHAHKTEMGALRLGLTDRSSVQMAAKAMPSPGRYLIEQMIDGTVAELLLGITREPPCGFLLTIGAGGVLTELMADARSLMLPATREEIQSALRSLRIWPLLEGYRGKPSGDVDAVVDAAMALQRYVAAHADGLQEIEINPLIVTPTRAVAVDALIRQSEPPHA